MLTSGKQNNTVLKFELPSSTVIAFHGALSAVAQPEAATTGMENVRENIIISFC